MWGVVVAEGNGPVLDAGGADRFPSRAVRDVRVVYARQSGCPSDFALVRVDFEPWLAGIALELADGCVTGGGAPEEHRVYRDAFVDGVRAELEVRSLDAAVALVVRELGVHEGDSHEGAFHWAGRLAVRACLERLNGRPPRARRRRFRR